MPIDVVVVPDIYYRDWNTPLGEMWLVLRPMIYTGKKSNAKPLGDRLGDFIDWANAPHTSINGATKRYRFVSPHTLNLGLGRCPSDECYLPIVLPSDIDVEVQIGRGTAAAVNLVVPRTQACKVVPGPPAESVDCFEEIGTRTPSAYVRVFNEDTSSRLKKYSVGSSELNQAIFYWMQQMEAGRRLRVMTGRVRDLYDPNDVPMPVLADASSSAGPITSVYWFLGQMIRLGTQANLGSIKNIDRLDILLKANGQVLDDPIYFPDNQVGKQSALAYFSKVGVGFERALECEVDRREQRVYVSPGFRSAQADQTLSAKRLWVIERPATRPGATTSGAPKLSRLGAIEFRDGLAAAEPGKDKQEPRVEPIGNQIAFIPGLLVKGALRPYRRFPMVKASAVGQPRRVTVLEFVPDPSVARELDTLRAGLNPVEFAKLFSTSTADWEYSLLHAGALPWDGPQTKYRIAARPFSTAGVALGASLMCEESTLAFFMAPVSGSQNALHAPAVDSTRSLWRADVGTVAASTVDQVAAQWTHRYGPVWAALEFNALEVFGLTRPDQVAVSVMMLDEFNFNAADSATQLERVMSTLATSPRTAALCNVTDPADPRNFDPLRDYEDDYVNQNSAQIQFADGGVAGAMAVLGPATLRTPMRTEIDPVTCNICDVNRRQTIPLLHGWPSEPMDRPEREWPAQVLPDMVREEVGKRYGALPDPEAGPYTVTLEHTYGDRLIAAKSGVNVRFARSTHRDWPVELPTSVEHQAATIHRFVECSLIPGATDQIRLHFDLSFLKFAPIPKKVFKRDGPLPSEADLALRRQYARAVTAWRALAELASTGAVVQLEVRQVVYSVEQGLSRLPSPVAASLAREGFPEGWGGGVGEIKPIIISGQALEAVCLWARDVVTKPVSLTSSSVQEFDVPLPPGAKLGQSAHLVQIRLSVRRHPSHAAVPMLDQHLVPISQQPGLYRVRDDTMQAAWAGLGFSPKAPSVDAAVAGQAWPSLQAAQCQWTSARTEAAEAIAPRAALVGTSSSADKIRTALIAHLPGTDWFAPAGAGPRPAKLCVSPLLVPVGFAPCRPHVALKGLTQVALQGFGMALTDAIDLSYVHWTTSDVAFYQLWFSRLAALARADGAGWAGPLPVFAKMLTDRLLFPQPDEVDQGNDGDIMGIAAAIRSRQEDLAFLPLAVQRHLIANPSVFAQTKALLLTQLRFEEDATAGDTPEPQALAGARFKRYTSDATGQAADLKTISVGLPELVLSAKAPAANFKARLGFLEFLDDSAYGNAFEVPSAGLSPDCVIESYEDKIDATGDRTAWKQVPARLPLVAANAPGLGRRPVHLASRALVVPPQVQPINSAGNLDKALRASNPHLKDWGLEDLRQGKAGYGGSGPILRMVARRARATGGADAIESTTAYVLYAVTGDEERSQSLLASFGNDSFFLDLRDGRYDQGVPLNLASELPRAEVEVEKRLRELAFAERGSIAAAQAMELLAFPTVGFDFAAALESFVNSSSAELPAQTQALLRTSGTTALAPIRDYGDQAQATRARLTEVALFGLKQDSDQAGPRNGYLLVGFEVSVWRPVEARLTHGRNVPEAPWTGGADAIDTPRFAKEFWQSAAQEGSATRHALANRSKANKPSDWGKPGHVVKLCSCWRRETSAKNLICRLLLTPGVAIGDHAPSGGVLQRSSGPLLFSQELSIQVYHLQFLADPDTPGAVPFSTVATAGHAKLRPNSKQEDTPMPWFDKLYDHFSVDFRWFAPNGTSLLTLSNIFVQLTDQPCSSSCEKVLSCDVIA